MVENRVCALFGIRYPVVMGGVSRTHELGAAVSRAGGLGCIQAGPPEVLQREVERFRAVTDRPFSVNVPIVLTPADQLAARMEGMVACGVPVVITSAGNPKLWTGWLKERGVGGGPGGAPRNHARKAIEAGVDAVIAEPVESGGYRGENEVSMMVLIRAIRRAYPEFPIIAAGAVADGEGMAAVMALGADGVQLGTRFIATVEARAAEHVTRLILAATDTSTTSAEGRVKPRIGKPEFVEEVLGERRQVQMGQVSALIDSVETVDAVMTELVEGGLRAARRTAAAFEALEAAAPAGR